MNRNLPFVLFGAGGHGKVVLDAALAANRKILFVVDDAPHELKLLGRPVIKSDAKRWHATDCAAQCRCRHVRPSQNDYSERFGMLLRRFCEAQATAMERDAAKNDRSPCAAQSELCIKLNDIRAAMVPIIDELKQAEEKEQ